MRNRPFLLALVLLLLAGCTSVRPAGSAEAVCDCRRTVKVPDKAFRTLLLEQGLATKAHGNRLRATAEGCAKKTLECYDRDIRSLQGIELFPQLEELVCSDNPIGELDLRGLPRLERLYALNVPLHALHADSCHRMRRMQLSHTRLEALDVGPWPELELLLVIFTPLTALDLSPCRKLTTLYIRGTRITDLDLRANDAMHELHALDTPLRTLTVTPEQRETLRASIPDSVLVRSY